jgi:hypothetical protein
VQRGYLRSIPVFEFATPYTLTAVLVCLPPLTYRLAVAYRRYLAFPHAILVVLLSQSLVMLAILALDFALS